MPQQTSQQNGTTASTHETNGEALRIRLEQELGRLHVNLGRLAAGEVDGRDLELLARLNTILAIRLYGSAPQPTPPQADEPQPEPPEQTPGEPGGVDAPEPDPEESSEQFHDRRLREIIIDEAQLKGLTPGQEVSLNIGYIVRLTYGGEIEKDVFHTHFEWLQHHRLFTGRKDNVFEFTIPKPPEAEVFVPSLDDCLAAMSKVFGIQHSSTVPLHVNQIAEQLFGHKPSKPELNAMIATIELHPRFIKQRRTMYLVALEPYVDEPSPILPTVPGSPVLPVVDAVDDGVSALEECIVPTKEAILELFDDYADLTRRLADIFVGGHFQRLELIRKRIPELADQEEYEDFKKHYSNHRETIQAIILEAGYACVWRQNNLTTRGRAYRLFIFGLDNESDEEQVAPSTQTSVAPQQARDTATLIPPEPEPEPITPDTQVVPKPDPLNIPVGGILDARREARRLTANEQQVQDFIDEVVDWGIERANDERIGIATSRLAGTIHCSIEVAREVLDNLYAAGYAHYRKRDNVTHVVFRKVPRNTKR